MALVQETNSDNLENIFDFQHNEYMLSVLIRIARLDEAIFMSTLNIQFHDKIRNNP